MSHFLTPPPFIRQRGGSLHREVDLSELAKTFSQEPVPKGARSRIVGPYDLHVFDQRRKQERIRSEHAIPADYFIWATGEPPHPAMTKLGGIPYLPASHAWPRREGTHGDFYAQLNFTDSRDIVPSLPGDVLLVFRFHDLDYTSWDDSLYEFLWVNMDEQDLIRLEDVRCSEIVAKSDDPWHVMHGYRVRTFDDPSQVERVRTDDSLEPHLHVGEATKIAGAANDMQSIWSADVPSDYRFIGQITAVWPKHGVPFPVVDRAAPVGDPSDPDYRDLTSGPGDGVTSLYLDGDGLSDCASPVHDCASHRSRVPFR